MGASFTNSPRLPSALFPFQAWGVEWARQCSIAIESALRDAIRSAEGHLPDLPEVAEHARALIDPHGITTYKWRGATILIVHPAAVFEGKLQMRMERPEGLTRR